MPRGYPFISLVGNRYSSLTVIGFAGVRLDGRNKDHPNRIWNCRCDCGKTRVYRANDLRRGKATFCGCKRRNTCSDRIKTLYYIEKCLGPEAMKGLSRAREADEKSEDTPVEECSKARRVPSDSGFQSA
jgi:hypothetical protein